MTTPKETKRCKVKMSGKGICALGTPGCIAGHSTPSSKDRSAPLPPEVLADAHQDVVHQETGEGRAARSVKVRAPVDLDAVRKDIGEFGATTTANVYAMADEIEALRQQVKAQEALALHGYDMRDNEIEALRAQLAAAKEFKATFSVQALRDEIEVLRAAVKIARHRPDAGGICGGCEYLVSTCDAPGVAPKYDTPHEWCVGHHARKVGL